MKKIFGAYTIEPGKSYSFDELNFIEELKTLDQVGYYYPHFIDVKGEISSYGCAVISVENKEIIEFISLTYEITPNRVYHNLIGTWHLVFDFEKSVSKTDYDRISKVLAFLYSGISIDYHFFEGYKVEKDILSDTIDETLYELLNNIYYNLQLDTRIEKDFTILDFNQYLETKKIPYSRIFEKLGVEDQYDPRHNFSKKYGYNYNYVFNYFNQSLVQTFLFFNESFGLNFNTAPLMGNENFFTDGKLLRGDGTKIGIKKDGYYTINARGEPQQITDFFIKVYYRIKSMSGANKFIVSLVSAKSKVETKKIKWSNDVSINTIGAFTQQFGNYHFFGGAKAIKDIHKLITEITHIPTMTELNFFGDSKEYGIIILKNGIFDKKEKIFTPKKEGEDYYLNYNGDGYFVSDLMGNPLINIIGELIPTLKENIVEYDEMEKLFNSLYRDDTGLFLLYTAFGMMGYLMYGDLKQKFPLIFAKGLTSCVDCETEYLTPTGWKYIKDYKEGDIIGEYNKDTGLCIFNKPIDYIKEKQEYGYRIKTSNLDMLVTDNHRILYKSGKGVLYTKQLKEIIPKIEKYTDKKYNNIFIPTVFNIEDRVGIDLSNDEIRLMVAIIGDGTFARYNTNWCRINIKKERKKERLRILLKNCNIEFNENNWNPKDLDYMNFCFYAPRRDKVFDEYYWGCNKKQLAIISEECEYWDGYRDKKSGALNFSTTIQKSADFIQYAMLITNQTKTSCVTGNRIGEKRIYGNGKEYIRKSNDIVVRSTVQKSNSTRMEYKDIQKEKMPDGYKYCFTTSTGYFVARRNGRIFLTGNSGKTSGNGILKTIFGLGDHSVDFGSTTLFSMTIGLSSIVKLPYFISEYREASSGREQKIGVLRSVFDKQGQTKGKADQTLNRYDFYGLPILDGEEMITDPAVRTRSIQRKFSGLGKIEGNFNDILHKGRGTLESIFNTYLKKSNGSKYDFYYTEGYWTFKKMAKENRIVENIAHIYAGCMCFFPENQEKITSVLSNCIKYQNDDHSENSSNMEIIKLLTGFLSGFNGFSNVICVLPDNSGAIIKWTFVETYFYKSKMELTLKLDTYKDHLEGLGLPVKFVDTGEQMIYGIYISADKIPKEFLVNEELYLLNRIYINGPKKNKLLN